MIGSATKSRKLTLSPSSAHIATISSEPRGGADEHGDRAAVAADEQHHHEDEARPAAIAVTSGPSRSIDSTMSAKITLAPEVVTVSPSRRWSSRTALANRIRSWPFHSSSAVRGPDRDQVADAAVLLGELARAALRAGLAA